MATRYSNRKVTRNNNELYKEFFEDRGVNFIRQFRSPELKYPTASEISSLEKVGHIWGVGDRYYKLAHKYYGSSTYWWVIAWFNKTPTEGSLKLGDTISIPLPLERILEFFQG